MGSGAEYFYGPVQDYSIKTNMNSGAPNRGWTWGVAGVAPVAAIAADGRMQIASTLATGGTITVGGGTGKINVGTVDPIYTIDGKRYATYLPGMTGQKEETTGNVECAADHGECTYAIDFKTLQKGSDLWLFGKATNIAKHFGDLTVLLTPAFDGKVWYEKDSSNLRLVVHAYASKDQALSTLAGQANDSLEISYRLTAPRFDAAKWTNYADGTEEGFNLDKLGIN
jgi:hypothetical protein